MIVKMSESLIFLVCNSQMSEDLFVLKCDSPND